MKEVLILEDKSETRKVLAGLVKEVRSDAVIYEAADEKTAYDIAMKRTIDLFLVDIILHPQQHDDVSGGKFAQNIRKVDKYLFTPILIITSMYDPKMCMYSSVHCYQFIEKPFDFEKVKQTIQEAIRYETVQEKDRSLMFRTEGMLEMIAVSEIVYVESVNHRLEIVTTSGRIEIPYKTCNSLLKELDSDNFVLCKHGVIVNLEFVKKVDTVNRYILLTDDFGSLEIGPILKNDFIKKMKARGII